MCTKIQYVNGFQDAFMNIVFLEMNLIIVDDSHLNSYCIIIWYCFPEMITFIFNKFSLMLRAEIKLFIFCCTIRIILLEWL